MHVRAFAPALLVLLAAASAQQQTLVSTGQQLVTAVQQAWTTSTQSYVVTINNSVSLANVTAISAPTSQSASTLNLSVSGQGLPAVSGITLDAAMRGYLLPSLTGQSTLSVSQITAKNLCCEIRWWNQTAGYSYVTAAGFYLFGPESAQTGIVPSKHFSNLVLYVPQLEVLMYMYWAIIQTSSFTSITTVAPNYLTPSINFQVQVSNMTQYSITYQSAVLSGNQLNNVQLRATNDPSIPTTLQISTSASFCNGTAINSSLDVTAMNTTLFPFWLAQNSATLQDSISAAGLYTQTKALTDPLAVVFLSGTMVLGGDRGQYPAVTMRAECLLHGPLVLPASSPPQARLNMGIQANVLQLAWRGRLYLEHLVMDQLILGPVDSTNYASSLPLWSVNMVTRTSPQVYLDMVTLSLPLADYVAILSAVLRGSAWKTGAVTTASLFKGIDTLQTQSGFAGDAYTTAIPIAVYSGWGVYGTNLTINISTFANYTLPLQLPDSPYPPPASSPSASGATVASSLQAQLGLGIGLGVGLTAAVIVAAVFLQRRKTRRQAMEQADKAKKDQSEGAQLKALGAISSTGFGRASGRSNGAEQSTGDANVTTVTINPDPTAKSPKTQTGDAAWLDICSKVSSHPSHAGPSVSDTASEPLQSLAARKSGAVETQQLNVAVLHAAVKAKQAFAKDLGSQASGTSSGPNSQIDHRREGQQPAAALGNTEVDKLTLLGVLGRGTWGTVYKGLWRNLDVAVKTVLFSNRTDGKGSLPHERAIMEAAVCTSVAHRNVVATYHYDIKPVVAVEENQGLQVAMSNSGMDLLATEWKLYLVQEWCQTSVGAAMRSGLLHNPTNNGLPMLDVLLSLLLDLTAGLAYLHDTNIIHGDLKPENIMLNVDHSSPTGVVAKITDFGLSTTLGPTATHVSNFNSGTPFYVAPEVVSEGRVTKSSDLYSFGVVMWELYHNSAPWVKDTRGVYNSHPSFGKFPPGAPEPYVTLSKQCANRDWRSRPTLETVIAQLQAMHSAWLAGYDSLQMGVGAVTAGVDGETGVPSAASVASVASALQPVVSDATTSRQSVEIAGAESAPAACSRAVQAPIRAESDMAPSTHARIPSRMAFSDVTQRFPSSSRQGSGAAVSAGDCAAGTRSAAAIERDSSASTCAATSSGNTASAAASTTPSAGDRAGATGRINDKAGATGRIDESPDVDDVSATNAPASGSGSGSSGSGRRGTPVQLTSTPGARLPPSSFKLSRLSHASGIATAPPSGKVVEGVKEASQSQSQFKSHPHWPNT